ncbi:MAG TPA: HAD family hydrolase, partial [Bacilli bacterium]
MNRQTILFDLDDTLIYCNKYFMAVIERFAVMMSGWFAGYGFTPKDFKRTQKRLDLAGVKAHGFVKERFPQSLVETYDYYSARAGRKKSGEEARRLFELGLSVYEQNIEFYPHMEQTLTALQANGHDLILYTGGDENVQRAKVKKGRLERFFAEKIYVAPYKTTDDLQRILQLENLRRESTWMVGNSERTD